MVPLVFGRWKYEILKGWLVDATFQAERLLCDLWGDLGHKALGFLLKSDLDYGTILDIDDREDQELRLLILGRLLATYHFWHQRSVAWFALLRIRGSSSIVLVSVRNDHIIHWGIVLLSYLLFEISDSHNLIGAYLKYLESYRAVECDQSTILGLQLMFHSKYTGGRIDILLHPWTLCLLRRDLLYFRTLDVLCGSDWWRRVWLPPLWKHLRFVFPLCPNVWLSLICLLHHHLEPMARVRLCVAWLILCSSPINLRIDLPYLRLQHPLIHGLCHQTVA
jgi:hypothetical protein